MTEINPDNAAVQNVASILKSYCGRSSYDGTFQDCGHDHTADASALVEVVAEDAVPRALRQLLGGTQESRIPRSSLEKIATEMELRAVQRAEAYPPAR